MKVCIVGGGMSGLTAAKACLEEGLHPVVFERSDGIGGLWRFTEKVDGKACVMRSTTINTSKEMSAFSDFPPPPTYANYMHNTKVMSYFTAYAEANGLMELIRYNTEVVSIVPLTSIHSTSIWQVHYKEGGSHKTENFDAVMVCTGHHAIPNKPSIPGLDKFPGRVLHSHEYRGVAGSDFTGERVIVIGLGNSAGDIAVELSHVTSTLYLSTRRGTWVHFRMGERGMPKDLLLSTRLTMCIFSWLPLSVINWLMAKKLNQRFDHDFYHIRPANGPLQEHGFVNDSLPDGLSTARIIIKSDVASVEGNEVVFADGTRGEVDTIVLATGYRIQFPFLDPSIITVRGNELGLYKHTWLPRCEALSDAARSTLAFIGYVQPHGPTIPIAEMQSRWAVRVFRGLGRPLPSSSVMQKYVAKQQAAIHARYVASERHTMQVDYIPFMDILAQEVGCKPSIWKLALTDPRLAWHVFIGPCTAYQYRLRGPHSWLGARSAIMSQWDRIAAPLNTRALPKQSWLSNTKFYSYLALVGLYVAVVIHLNDNDLVNKCS